MGWAHFSRLNFWKLAVWLPPASGPLPLPDSFAGVSRGWRKGDAAWIPFGDHPWNLERYREDYHGFRARMTRTNREAWSILDAPTCKKGDTADAQMAISCGGATRGGAYQTWQKCMIQILCQGCFLCRFRGNHLSNTTCITHVFVQAWRIT